MDDVQRAVRAMHGKLALYNDYFAYYDGDHPLVYVNKKLAEIFGHIDVHLSENWCAVVVDALLDRVTLESVRVAGEKKQAFYDRVWQEQGLDNEAEDVYQAMLVTGEGFLIVWQGGSTSEPNGLEVYANDPRTCHVFYHPDRPKVKEYACKLWFDEGVGALRLNLYYPDRIEYYRAEKEGNALEKESKFARAGEPGANPYGVVPVFHFQVDRRKPISVLKSAIPLQVAINKEMNDLIVTSEFGAFRQRWIISNADVGALKNAPNEIWTIPAGDGQGQSTQVGEFEGSDLGRYIEAIDHFSNAMSAITRTPKHYFFQSGNISGEALDKMEAPLVKKAKKIARRTTAEWREAMRFIALLGGKRLALATDVQLVFADPETVNPKEQAETRFTNKQAGIPITTQLRWEGKSDEQIAVLYGDYQTESEKLAVHSKGE